LNAKRPAREVIEKGSTIDLVVSRGPQMVEMPNVAGFTRDGAEQQLAQVGLNASFYPIYNDGSYVSGCVAYCSEEPGAMVEVGSVITVYIAADPSVEITTEPPAASDSGSGESASSSGETAPDDTVYDTD
jgi:histidine kinase